MALWEYKVITSGLHGFASPALLEAHLNALGKDEWEIIHFQTVPNNPLAFNGLARRSTTRDWSPPVETVISSPARPSLESSYVNKPAAAPTPAAGVKPEQETLVSRLEEKAEAAEPAREASLRPMRDTERDLDPDAEEEEGEDDWDNWEEENDDLPTFFEAIKPHLRRNQKGPGMSVAVDYLAKRWEQREADLVGALKECGFTIPESEESDPDYFEFEGDLYWINKNNRGQLFINTREKPRPVFRTVQAKKLAPDDPATSELAAERAAEKAEIEKRHAEKAQRAERQAAAAAARESGPAVADQPDAPSSAAETESAGKEPAGPLPAGADLLEKIRPMMRRNRRGPGYSGSVSYLARALKHSDADVTAALAALGLNTPASPNDKPVYVEIGQGVYWMNKDSRGGIWINGREKREGGQRQDKGGSQPQASQGGEPAESASGSVQEGATSAAAGTAGEVSPPAQGGATAEASSTVSGVSDASSNQSAAPEGEPVTPMKVIDPAAERAPDREVAPRAAETGDAGGSANAGAEGGTAEGAANAEKAEADSSSSEAKAEEATGAAPAEGEGSDTAAEGDRPAKPAKARRPSRPRTRKPKTEGDAGAPSGDSEAKPEESV